MPQLDTLYF